MLDEITRKMDDDQATLLKKMGEMITPLSWPSRTSERKGRGRSPGRGCFQCVTVSNVLVCSGEHGEEILRKEKIDGEHEDYSKMLKSWKSSSTSPPPTNIREDSIQ